MNILLMYPPGLSFQRGEERCQIDIEASVVNSYRPCNDLGYASSTLKKLGYTIYLKDYQGEHLSVNDLCKDVENIKPDVVFISITTGSIYNDLEVVKKIKEIKSDTIIILKGALFFNPEESLFNQLDLSNIDYLIGGEPEFITDKLVYAHFNDKSLLKNIQGISYKENGKWISQYQTIFYDDLDSLPFPDRSLMNNKLYINPDTNRPMAIITTSKGCNYNCIYCLSPIISGKKVRFRSVESIFAEIKECVEKYNIVDFFFKSDTFTVNKQKVMDLCKLIQEHHYEKKINWFATARVDTLDEELLSEMKKSGLSLLAIGFESGSNDSLRRMKKNNTVETNLRAAKLCKKYKIKMLGYFLVGFQWEDEKHLKETEKHIFDINADFIEISVVVPFYRTPLYEEYCKEHKLEQSVFGFDSFNHFYENYSKIPVEYLKQYRKRILIKYYLRPTYIFSKIKTIKSVFVFKNYVKFGLRLLKNLIIH